jgi:hypothetical protein
MITTAIQTLLTADAPTVAATNGVGGGSILRGTVAPYIIHEPSKLTAENDADGNVVDHHEYNVDVYGTGFQNAFDVAQLVRTALDRYTGTVDTSVISSILFEDQIYAGMATDYADKDVYHIAMGFRIWETK